MVPVSRFCSNIFTYPSQCALLGTPLFFDGNRSELTFTYALHFDIFFFHLPITDRMETFTLRMHLKKTEDRAKMRPHHTKAKLQQASGLTTTPLLWSQLSRAQPSLVHNMRFGSQLQSQTHIRACQLHILPFTRLRRLSRLTARLCSYRPRRQIDDYSSTT